MKTTEQHLAEVLTDSALGARLLMLSSDVRRFTAAQRTAFLCEAAKRLGYEEAAALDAQERAHGHLS